MAHDTGVAAQVACPQCGALVPAAEGPVHAYFGAAPGCWALYGEVLAREYSDVRYAGVHRLTVDAYAAQHPGQPERRAIQSVAVHLIGLHLALERALPVTAHPRFLKAAADASAMFHWLTPPVSMGDITVRDVHAVGDDAEAHHRIVRAWAEGTWAAWSEHHAEVRAWAGQVMSRTGQQP